MKLNIRFAAALLGTALIPFAALAHESPIKATGTLIDVMCSEGATQAKADEHTKECGLMGDCVKSGYGIVIDGKFHKFDAAGSKLAEQVYRSTKKSDHIHAAVVGTQMHDGSIMVKTLTETE